MAENLSSHLDNARLFAELESKVAELAREREVRERFVGLLAHDLRSPLGAAKFAAQALLRDAEGGHRDLALRIDRTVDRVERMIRDLLDANRIDGGERLPLR